MASGRSIVGLCSWREKLFMNLVVGVLRKIRWRLHHQCQQVHERKCMDYTHKLYLGEVMEIGAKIIQQDAWHYHAVSDSQHVCQMSGTLTMQIIQLISQVTSWGIRCASSAVTKYNDVLDWLLLTLIVGEVVKKLRRHNLADRKSWFCTHIKIT